MKTLIKPGSLRKATSLHFRGKVINDDLAFDRFTVCTMIVSVL